MGSELLLGNLPEDTDTGCILGLTFVRIRWSLGLLLIFQYWELNPGLQPYWLGALPLMEVLNVSAQSQTLPPGICL